MPYTASNANTTLDEYLGVGQRDDVSKRIIQGTKNRGFVLTLPNGEEAVIFTYPIVHKQDNTKNYFDTRDSGPHERATAWNYAIQNHHKYFCLGVHDQVDKYVDYVFSLECNERDIEKLSGTEGGDRSTTASGNQIIIPNNYIPSKPFERITNNLGTFISVIHRDSLYDYLEKYDNRPYLIDKEMIELAMAEGNTSDPDEQNRIAEGTNILLYGVPGSGKSWTIEHEYCKPGSIVERLVFHPDYTNGDFVGQILPVVDEEKQVTYEFTPGPFTRILRDAYINPDKEYVLIIEEINRGNAPAIFGEIFQLLDRCVEPKTEGDVTYPAGTSEYGITHASVAEYVYDDPGRKVRIPSNLSIVATMNTSDQNVFTLDTAFQRRWKMRLIDNYFDNVRDSLADAKILDTDVTWKRFCESINSIIVGNKSRMVSAEDKRMGVYFIHEKDVAFDFTVTPSEGYPTILVEYNSLLKTERANQLGDSDRLRLFAIRNALMQNRIFPEKVIKYLWDDAFKFNPEALFDTERFDNLEDIIKEFVFSTGNDRFNVFKREVRTELLQGSQE